MTTREFFQFLSQHPGPVLAVLAAIPGLTVLWGLIHPRTASSQSPWKHGYGVLTYLACIPGVLAAVITAYMLFFSRENLLDLDLVSTLGPLASMVATLVLIRRRLSFAEVPGFDRLSGLITLLALSFALALIIDKTRIFVGFFGSVDRLLMLGAAVFVLLRTAAWAVFRRRRPGDRVRP